MRFILPVIGAALALSIGVSAAVAQHHRADHRHHQAPSRVKSHVALHVLGHSVLTGDGVTVRGKVRPSGGHQVEVVFSGPAPEVLTVHTKSNGTFKAHWTVGDIGNYKVTAHAVASKRVRGWRGRPTTAPASTATASPAAAPWSRGRSASPTRRCPAARR